jgi:predicted  nucleic acid-binding Zn-ribbon protein
MDYQTILNAALALISSVTGWFARELWAAVKELKADLAKLREDLPKSYVAKDDYKNDIRELKEMINKIFDKLDHKTDKF